MPIANPEASATNAQDDELEVPRANRQSRTFNSEATTSPLAEQFLFRRQQHFAHHFYL